MSRDRRLARRFGTIVRQHRARRGFSQEVLAERTGLHRTYIGHIERGEKTVTIATAARLARGLGLSLAEIFAEVEGRRAARRQGKRLS